MLSGQQLGVWNGAERCCFDGRTARWIPVFSFQFMLYCGILSAVVFQLFSRFNLLLLLTPQACRSPWAFISQVKTQWRRKEVFVFPPSHFYSLLTPCWFSFPHFPSLMSFFKLSSEDFLAAANVLSFHFLWTFDFSGSFFPSSLVWPLLCGWDAGCCSFSSLSFVVMFVLPT